MNNIKINERIFKKILITLKDCVAKDNARPALQYIRLEIKADKIVGYSLDGYRSGRIIIPCKEPNKEEFVAYIKAVPFKTSAGEMNDVIISSDGANTTVEFEQPIGKIRYQFQHPDLWKVDMEEIWENAKRHDREIGVNATYLSRAFKTLAEAGDDHRNRLAILETKRSRVEAFCISAQAEGGIQLDQLVLPIRTSFSENPIEDEKTAKLVKLINENPSLPVVPLVYSEVVADDGYAYWIGSWGDCYVDEYVCVEKYGENRFYTRGDQDEIEEYFAEEILYKDKSLSDEQVEKMAHEQAEALPWKKAILVYVGTPEVE